VYALINHVCFSNYHIIITRECGRTSTGRLICLSARGHHNNDDDDEAGAGSSSSNVGQGCAMGVTRHAI